MTPENEARLAQCRKYGEVTPSGVCFEWQLVSIEGAGFCSAA